MGRPKLNSKAGKLVQDQESNLNPAPEPVDQASNAAHYYGYGSNAQQAQKAMAENCYEDADAIGYTGTTEVPLAEQIKERITFLTDQYTDHIKNLRYAERMLIETRAEETVNTIKRILNINKSY